MVKSRATLTALFASLATVFIGAQFVAVGTTPHELQNNSANSDPTAPDPSAPSLNSPTPPTTTGAAFRDGTATGTSVSTPYGEVQVKVTVSAGSIADVIPVQLTNRGGESVQISNYAAPILRNEVLQSQSASVSSVSGATYTSFGYLGSLQSALDQLAP